jgi:cob(I)alamin adenosyltransferase
VVGLIQVYTGEGKGKTTAALGLALRALGHGMKVGIICFHKDPNSYSYGEYKSLSKLGAHIFCFAKRHPHFFKDVSKEMVRKECLEGVRFIKRLYEEKEYDILILDEILISLRDGFLKEEEVGELLDKKPKELEVVLTGRGAPLWIIKRAHLVSEIKEIKHPYKMGIERRKGIEY